MTQVLSETFKPGLATKIEENLIAYFVYCSRARQAGLHRGKELIQFSTKIAQPSPYFNLVLQANFATPESAHHHIRRIQRKAQIRNIPLFWLVGSSTRPANLGKFLKNYQFSHTLCYSGMMIDLGDLNEGNAAPAGLTIEAVRTPKQLRQFVTVLGATDQMSETVIQAWFEQEASLGTDPNAPLQRYLGLWYGRPVATCATFAGAGVVGLYHLTTLPGVRGYGVGTAITLTALQAAHRFNRRYGVSLATPLATKLYHRLGFQVTNEFNFYRWQSMRVNS